MTTHIHKTCLDEITFSDFMELFSFKDKNLFSEKINALVNNKFGFIRSNHELMNEKNPDWEQLIYKEEQLTDNFDLVYANYFFEEKENGVTYDFNVILKCKTMPFIARFLFDTEPDNFSDKNDLDIFPDIESTLSFFNPMYHRDTVHKSLNDYETLQRHLFII